MTLCLAVVKGYKYKKIQRITGVSERSIQHLVALHQHTGCQEAALTRRTSRRRSGGGVGLGPSGKQLHPATPELTAWQERLADGSQ